MEVDLVMKKTFALIILVIVLSAIGCDGSGDGSSATPSDTTFYLFPEGYFTLGYQELYNMTGSDTDGGRYSASQLSQTGSYEIINNIELVPRALLIELTKETTGEFISCVQAEYYAFYTSGLAFLGFEDKTLGVSFMASSMNIIPETAQIDDFGTIGTYEDSVSGETMFVSWKLTNANNGMANFVLSFTYRDEYGEIYSTEEQTYVIDEDGDRKSLSVRVFDAESDSTLMLSGPRTSSE